MEQERLDKRIKELEEKAKAEKEEEAKEPIKQPEEIKEEKVLKLDPSKVLTQCPNCEKKQRQGDEMGVIATRYNVFMGPGKDPQPSLLKIACPYCGVESFRGKDLLILREKAKQMKATILVPEPTLRTQ